MSFSNMFYLFMFLSYVYRLRIFGRSVWCLAWRGRGGGADLVHFCDTESNLCREGSIYI